jgi:RNA polymerase sigma-32 factor
MAKRKSNSVGQAERRDTGQEMVDQDIQDISEPTDEEVTEQETPSDSDAPPAPELIPASDSTSLIPVTALQQYLSEIRRYPYLSKEEELQLFRQYQLHGDRDAAVKLILANLRVAVAIAAEYLHTGADHMDLIQEGNVGLLQAIKKFDPSKNVRFYAYAAWWTRAYILRYLLNNYRLVKVGTTQDQRKLFYNLKKERPSLSGKASCRIQSSWQTGSTCASAT